MNFKLRIALAMIISSLTIIILIGWGSLFLSKDTLEKRTQDFLTTALVNHATDIHQMIFAAEKSATSITSEVELTLNTRRFTTDPLYRARYLETIEGAVRLSAEITTSHSSFVIFLGNNTPTSIWYADGNKDSLPEKIIRNDLIKRIDLDSLLTMNWSNGQSVWLKPDYTSDFFTVIHPILLNQELVGFSGGDVSNDQIKSLLRKVTFINSAKSWVQLESGELVTFPRGTADNYQINSDFISSLDVAIPSFGHNDTLMIGAMRLTNDWQLVTTVELSDVYNGLNRLNYIIIGMMFLALIASIVIANIVATRISEPYSYLATTIEKIGAGDYEVKIKTSYIDRKDEAGILSRAIDTMRNRQKQSFDTIKNYNLDLEKIITERTKQLLQSNRNLESALQETHEKQDTLMNTNIKLEASLKEIVKTKQQLISSEKIASLTHVLIGLSHNMNTPLGNAISMISFLQQKAVVIQSKYKSGTLTKKTLEDFIDDVDEISSIIFKNIETTNEYVTKFKELSTTRIYPTYERVNLKKLVYKQFEEISQRYPNISCHISVAIDDTLEKSLDVSSLEKLIYELLENSFVHGFENIPHPMITIEITEGFENPEYLLISYKDNGIGVPIDRISNLFTPLYTTKLTTHEGLGLNMLHNIVTQNFDGTIDVDVGRDYGLSYRITLNLIERIREENKNDEKSL
jgi:signal transduction histidine kinase